MSENLNILGKPEHVRKSENVCKLNMLWKQYENALKNVKMLGHIWKCLETSENVGKTEHVGKI